MKENCLDIGIVQAFIDGELSHDQIASVSDHLERCDSCAFRLASAEDEAALVFSALGRELDTLVPTQRLWARINESIEVQRESRPFREKLYEFLHTAFASPSLVTAAGLAIAFGVFSIIFMNREPVDMAMTPPAVSLPAAASDSSSEIPFPVKQVSDDSPAVLPPAVQKAVYRSRTSPLTAASVAGRAPARSNGYVEGEEVYVRAISSLARTVDEQKDTVLPPSERVAYERDMAVVNDTIAKMRQEVKRNPRNESAKQILYSSYQNKIDLLNSVSQREELVASLK